MSGIAGAGSAIYKNEAKKTAARAWDASPLHALNILNALSVPMQMPRQMAVVASFMNCCYDSFSCRVCFVKLTARAQSGSSQTSAPLWVLCKIPCDPGYE